ncbi:prolipoprotein diacylglyceryl transferase [Cohnella caldifontis]|uniref:prolipoprotein diacylglyceryl transferase n=1 Tax=Cohnella caldifontis TaxID=3027471 RepID=UPI0023EC3639|nr:prolipoprotein diacylglyceryl transferase [Cohnella sp. YIM B05605]
MLLSLDPIAFTLGPLSVHWYGIILGLGALVGLMLAVREGRRFGISPDFFLDLLLYGVPSAIIAARIYYVAFKWDYYQSHPGEIVQIWNGGIAIYGAIIGALICGFFYARAKGYPFIRIADICAPSLLAGQMIGRWGNFMNQEAYGGPTTETFLRNTLHLPNFIVDQMYIGEIYRHPTFLYESLWSLVGLIILFVIRRLRFLKTGEVLTFYFIWYSIGRFFVEALRTDSLAFKGPEWLASMLRGLWSPMTLLFDGQGELDPNYGNIRISQLLALVFVIAGIVFIAVRRWTGTAGAYYHDPLTRRSSAVPAADAALDEPAAGAPESSAHAAAAETPADDSPKTEERAEKPPEVPVGEQTGDKQGND